VLQHSGIQAGKSLVHENHEVNIQKNSPKINIPKRKRTREKASKQANKDLGPSNVFCMVESNFLQTQNSLKQFNDRP
jgi:hypothetical protein